MGTIVRIIAEKIVKLYLAGMQPVFEIELGHAQLVLVSKKHTRADCSVHEKLVFLGWIQQIGRAHV